ncbi:TPA: hypothetical protein ACFP4Y_001961 [Neisseria bacilliformis]|uniref:NAD-glutamate dehydrogenase n=1 Tax=Neisseria bacilliformis TaxID=267212 RepID=UPI001364BFA8|nr:NAD-glutamate dehydrogenase [Neisseria bacilliformis]
MKILPALTLALFAAHAAAQPPAADALKLPENVRIITAHAATKFCDGRAVPHLPELLPAKRRDEAGRQRQTAEQRLSAAGIPDRGLQAARRSESRKAIASIPNLSPLMDLAEREPEPSDAEIAAKAAPFCTANRAAFQRLMEWHNPQ